MPSLAFIYEAMQALPTRNISPWREGAQLTQAKTSQQIADPNIYKPFLQQNQ